MPLKEDFTKLPLHLILLCNGYSLLKMSLREMQKSKWIPLVKKFAQEKERIMVSIKLDSEQKPYYLYFNLNGDEGDRGNILNFCKNRGLNPQILVRNFKENKQEDYAVTPLIPTLSPSHSRQEFQAMRPCDIYHHPLFISRHLYPATLRAYQDYLKEDSHGNVCFPHYALEYPPSHEPILCLCGFTKRLQRPLTHNADGSPKAKPLKNIQKGHKGLEILKPQGDITQLILTESILDSLSYLQMRQFSPQHTLIASTAGRFGEEKIKAIFDFMLEKGYLHKPSVHIAMDNDAEGQRMSGILQRYFLEKLQEVPILYRPLSKDVNDDLKLQHLLQTPRLSPAILQAFLQKQLFSYQNTKEISVKNRILEKLCKIQALIALPRDFVAQFHQPQRHKTLKKI